MVLRQQKRWCVCRRYAEKKDKGPCHGLGPGSRVPASAFCNCHTIPHLRTEARCSHKCLHAQLLNPSSTWLVAPVSKAHRQASQGLRGGSRQLPEGVVLHCCKQMRLMQLQPGKAIHSPAYGTGGISTARAE